jgi:hypothetical protein
MRVAHESKSMTDEPVRAELNRISSSFCPLRWSYMQVDIQQGKVKACCKTSFQTLDRALLENHGTQAVFNSPYFQDRRREMLAGVKHEDCRSCWIQEDLGLLSYRILQSAEKMFRPVTTALASEGRVDEAKPKHLEIILSTLCDLKCSYCGPEFSSSWAVEIDKHGDYPLHPHGQQVSPEVSLFQEIFWRWFEQEADSIEYIQINGGEPLIQKGFYDFLDRMLTLRGRSKPLQIGVMTNLNASARKMERLRAVLPRLLKHCDLRFGVSQDSVGERAEYIRHGLNWDRFDQNLRGLIKEFPELSIQIAPTMSALNVTSIAGLLAYLDSLSREFDKEIILRPSIVMFPDFQSPLILTTEYAAYLQEAIDFLARAGRWPEMARRLEELIEAMHKVRNLDHLRRNFYLWFREYDKRRNESFLTVFPEMEGFWRHCSKCEMSSSILASRSAN